MALADKDGKLLEAGKLHKLNVPAKMPDFELVARLSTPSGTSLE